MQQAGLVMEVVFKTHKTNSTWLLHFLLSSVDWNTGYEVLKQDLDLSE